jgi:hypothetical protein
MYAVAMYAAKLRLPGPPGLPAHPRGCRLRDLARRPGGSAATTGSGGGGGGGGPVDESADRQLTPLVDAFYSSLPGSGGRCRATMRTTPAAACRATLAARALVSAHA